MWVGQRQGHRKFPIGNSQDPGIWGSLNSRSGIPGNFRSFWFVQKKLCKIWTKFASFASVICITKAHKCSSHMHRLQGQPDSPTYPTTVQWFSLRTVSHSHRCLTLCWCLIFFIARQRADTRDIVVLCVCPSVRRWRSGIGLTRRNLFTTRK